MSKCVLLTGAAGFIGSHLLNHLLVETDWHMVCPITLRHRGDSQRLDIDDWDASRVKIIYHDLRGPLSDVDLNLIGDIDYIVNVASESHVDRSIEDPVPFVETNVSLVLNMLEAARKLRPEKFVQFSTDEVYGPAPKGIDFAEWSTIIPSNPYSASKACQEAIAISYWRTFSVPVMITNTMNVIGERQDTEKFCPKVMRCINSHQQMPIHGDAETGETGSRYYLHARNAADAIVFLLRNESPQMYPGNDRPSRFNVVGDREMNNLDMAFLISDLMNKTLDYTIENFHQSRPGHDARYGLDGAKMRRLGWQAPLSLEESLAKTIDWTNAHPEWLK